MPFFSGLPTPPTPPQFPAGISDGERNAIIARFQAEQTAYASLMQAFVAEQRNAAEAAAKSGDQALARELADKAEAAAGNLRTWQGGQNQAEREAALTQLRTQGEESRRTIGSQSEAERALESLRQSGRASEIEKTQAFQGQESAAERAARLSELTRAGEQQRLTIGSQSEAEKALEGLRQTGRLSEIEKTQTFQGAESAAERAARLNELLRGGEQQRSLEETRGAQTRQTIGTQSAAEQALESLRIGGTKDIEALRIGGARTLAQDRAAAEMAQLEKQISGQQGLATSEQAARLQQLREELTSREHESAAERTARMEELRQTQSGTRELAGYQSTLQKQLEDARFLRAQQENEQAFNRSQQLLTRFGFGTDTAGANNAPAWLTSLVAPTGPTGTAPAPSDGARAAAGPAAGPSAGGGADGFDAQDKATEDAVWARAKDKIGQSNESAKRALSEELAARGIKGSGVEAQQLSALEAEGTGQLANTATSAALETLRRRYHVRDTDKALASQKRGQDIGLISSLTGSYRPTASGGAY